jgi:hypothetical protein
MTVSNGKGVNKQSIGSGSESCSRDNLGVGATSDHKGEASRQESGEVLLILKFKHAVEEIMQFLRVHQANA